MVVNQSIYDISALYSILTQKYTCRSNPFGANLSIHIKPKNLDLHVQNSSECHNETIAHQINV